MALRFVLMVTLVQAVLTLVAILTWPTQWLSIALGSGASLFNFWILALAWLFIFYKKRVAPSVGIVVIKYGILILFFSQIPQIGWINQNALVLGVLTNPAALLFGGILSRLIQNNRGN